MFSGSLRRIEEYNIKEAVYDLTTEAREAFLAEHKATLDTLIYRFSISPVRPRRGSTFQIQGVMALNRYDSTMTCNSLPNWQAQSAHGDGSGHGQGPSLEYVL